MKPLPTGRQAFRLSVKRLWVTMLVLAAQALAQRVEVQTSGKRSSNIQYR
jgi:hypothetical protein